MSRSATLSEPGEPPRRVVLLGASNLIWGVTSVVTTAQQAWGQDGPIDVLGAFGHGRSFGGESWFCGRSLPGILQSELWQELASRPPAPTAGLITDIGNDIVYGARAGQIAEWVERCLERLRPVCERLILTELPLYSLDHLGPWRFGLFRRLLFPRYRLTLDTARATAHELNDRVRTLAQKFDATLVRPADAWYGLDPIHVKPRLRPEAWRTIMSHWRAEPLAEPACVTWGQWCYLSTRRPISRKLLGIPQRFPQPTGRLADGSRLSFF